MNKVEEAIWPFSTRAALLATPVILLVLVIFSVLMRSFAKWPDEASEKFVVIGIFVFSMLPLMLVFADAVLQQGGSLEFKGVRLNLVSIPQARPSMAPIPTNIGVTAHSIGDSGSTEILGALKNASENEVIVVDLEQGDAWWETRLLVILAGAVRLQRPRAVVFVATEGVVKHRFQGWSAPGQLLRMLLRVDPRYDSIYAAVRAVTAQWEMTDPTAPPPVWMSPLAQSNLWMKQLPGVRPQTNELAPEQLLASQLGNAIENVGGSRSISVVRLKELFLPVLNTCSVDQQAAAEIQLKDVGADDAEFIAVTQSGVFLHLVRRLSVLTAMLTSIAKS